MKTKAKNGALPRFNTWLLTVILCAGVLVFGACGGADGDVDTDTDTALQPYVTTGAVETVYDQMATGTWIGNDSRRRGEDYEYFLPIIGWTDDGEFILGETPEPLPPRSTLIISNNRFSYTRLAVDRNTRLDSDFYEINSRNPILGVLIAANGEIATPTLTVGGVAPDDLAPHMWRVSIFQIDTKEEGDIFIVGTHPDGYRMRPGRNAYALTTRTEPDGRIQNFGGELTLTDETFNLWRFNASRPMTRLQ